MHVLSFTTCNADAGRLRSRVMQMARGGSHGSHAEERPMAVQEQSIAFDDSDGSQF